MKNGVMTSPTCELLAELDSLTISRDVSYETDSY